MRYSKDHKQATRQRILEAAGRRFKQEGIDGAGVATVMSDAGPNQRRLLRPLRV
jgi:AcrR family transcriptional regulator